MLIAFACDHAGFPFRESILEFLRKAGYKTIDLGPEQLEIHDDFP
jgi:ribose 5-phosphate isomerase RpiB